MADQIAFDGITPRLGLPLLFAAQAQKELTVNEASSRIDGLLHCCIEGIASAPPTAPAEGECWLVGESPAGAFIDQAGTIAIRSGGNWLFARPVEGMQVFDRGSSKVRFFKDLWVAADRPADPAGGTTVDAEARQAITDLYGILATLGLIPPN